MAEQEQSSFGCPDCVVKLGGAAITRKDAFETLDEITLGKVVEHVRRLRKEKPKYKLILIHGAGSFGHFQAKKHGVQGGDLKDQAVVSGFAQTRVSVTKLNHAVVEALVQQGIPAVSISPLSFYSNGSDGVDGPRTELVKGLLDNGFVPVIHGDAVLQSGSKSMILSGDKIVFHMTVALKPRFCLFLSNVHGIYSKPPELEGARLLRRFDLTMDKKESPEFTTMHAHDTTGGMEAKVSDASKIAIRGYDVLITKAGSDAAFEALSDFKLCIDNPKWNGTHVVPLEK